MPGPSQLDRCGLTLLAGKAVRAPFVGAVAAILIISEGLAAPARRRLARADRSRSQGAGGLDVGAGPE